MCKVQVPLLNIDSQRCFGANVLLRQKDRNCRIQGLLYGWVLYHVVLCCAVLYINLCHYLKAEIPQCFLPPLSLGQIPLRINFLQTFILGKVRSNLTSRIFVAKQEASSGLNRKYQFFFFFRQSRSSPAYTIYIQTAKEPIDLSKIIHVSNKK